MKTVRIIYCLARADFLERARSYRFLALLGLILFLGYQTTFGNLTFQLGQYRGEFNSAWIGAMMSIIASFFLTWFGFYMVKGSIARDRQTGVGQIIAATPITRLSYLLGKWLSNLAVLMAMVLLLAFMGLVLQVWKGAPLDVSAFFAPFLLIVLPLIALVAAGVILFESVPLLQGGFGNVLYFIGFVIGNMGRERSIYDPMGIGLLQNSMSQAALAAYPNYEGYFSLGNTERVFTFTWTGVQWTRELVLARFACLALTAALIFVAALVFDRFDSSYKKNKKNKPLKNKALLLDARSAAPAPAFIRLTPLPDSAKRYGFGNVLLAEMKLLLKGQRWWWYLVALGLIAVCLTGESREVRETFLPFVWVWPVLIWSSLGTRETYHNMQQIAFSSAYPLKRQLPAQWLAGFLFTLITGSGAALLFVLNADVSSLFAWFAGALFIPSLALALGVWSGNKKTFEIAYLSIWLMGPVTHNITLFDFINSSGATNPMIFALVSLVLIACAAAGRKRQLRN